MNIEKLAEIMHVEHENPSPSKSQFVDTIGPTPTDTFRINICSAPLNHLVGPDDAESSIRRPPSSRNLANSL